jgi:hypothetical protein
LLVVGVIRTTPTPYSSMTQNSKKQNMHEIKAQET